MTTILVTTRAETTRTVTAGKDARPGRAEADARIDAERYRAPFSLRCGALLIDYIIVAMIIAFSLLLAQPLRGASRAGAGGVQGLGLLVALAFAVLNFGVLAAASGRTLGKWATGLRIMRKDGGSPSWARLLLRHFVGYPLSLLPLGLGFIGAAFNAQNRGLHDLIAGTVVVRDVARAPRRPAGGR